METRKNPSISCGTKVAVCAFNFRDNSIKKDGDGNSAHIEVTEFSNGEGVNLLLTDSDGRELINASLDWSHIHAIMAAIPMCQLEAEEFPRQEKPK